MPELANLPVSHENTAAPVTAGNPLRSRPSRLFAITVLLVVSFGMLLPFTPWPRPSPLRRCPLCTFSSWPT